MRVKLEKIESSLEARIPKARSAAMFVVAENVRADSEPYVPLLHGALRGSARATVTPGGQGRVEWGGDQATSRYARRQHDVQHSNYTTPGTGPAWDEKAASSRSGAWVQMFAHEYGRRVGG